MLAKTGQSGRLAVATRRGELETYEPQSQPTGSQTPGVLVVAWRRRWIILTCVLLAIGCGLIYVWKAVPVYASTSVIYLQTSMPKILNDQFANVESTSDYLYNQCQLIMSTAIVFGAMDQPGVADADCLKGVDNPLGFIKSHIAAVPSRQGDLIYVTMESPTPKGAADIVNGIVASYVDNQSRMHESTAVRVVSILQKSVNQHEADLKQAQDQMLRLERQNPDFVFQVNDTGAGHTRMAQLMDDLAAAQGRALDLQMALTSVKTVQNDPAEMRRIIREYHLTDMVEGEDVSATMLQEYGRQTNRLQDLLDHYGPRNQAVIDQQRLVQRLHDALPRAAKISGDMYLDAVTQSLDMAQKRVKQLQDAIAVERNSTMSMTSKQIEFQQWAQEAMRAERALDLLDTRIKEINPTEDVGALTVQVLETAKPNTIPVRPNRGQAMAISIAAGLMVGLGLGYLRETFDQRLRSVEEVSLMLSLPVLGVVPHIPEDARKSPTRGQETATRPRSDVAEAFRTIRTALYFGAHDTRLVKTVLLTSPAVSDGKSTSTSNLAIAVSQAGRRVLLIDADCRRPTQNKIFKLEDGLGLSSVLSGDCHFEQAVRRGVLTRLDVLPCGPIPAHPAELLDSQAFVDLLKTVSAEYDHVFIDSPPVNPVSDPRIIAAFCDATILVLRAHHSNRRMAEHACQVLDSVGAKLLGVIVNDVSRRQRGYAYHYPYTRYGTNGDDGVDGDGELHPGRKALAVTGELVHDE